MSPGRKVGGGVDDDDDVDDDDVDDDDGDDHDDDDDNDDDDHGTWHPHTPRTSSLDSACRIAESAHIPPSIPSTNPGASSQGWPDVTGIGGLCVFVNGV